MAVRYPERPVSARIVSVGMMLCMTFWLAACSDEQAPEPAAAPGTPAGGAAPVAETVVEGEESPGRAVVSERLPYGEVLDELVYGHFVFPTDMVEPLPAVILIHEWWGLNETITQTADRIASQGYIVLAVDLFGGETTGDVAKARRLMLGVVENQAAAEDNIRQALEFVADTAGAPNVAVLGWGLGGSWALNTATRLPDRIDAAVVYYGQVSDEPSTLESIDAPVLGFFGDEDRTIKTSDVRAFENRMEDLGKAVEITIYRGAGHGFANPAGRNYDASLTRQSWDRTLGFLAESLSEGS